jgi:ParB family chromosome partitioning protein
MAEKAVEMEWTVKELKTRVSALSSQSAGESEKNLAQQLDPNVRAAEAELQRLLGTRVRITDHNGKGRIVIEYRNLTDFDRLLELLHAS